jgi:hypothetical protein
MDPNKKIHPHSGKMVVAESRRNNTTVEYARWTLVIIIGSQFFTLILSTEGGLESSNKI